MKKKLLLSSIMSIAMCLSLISGATFALFTDEASVNIAVTSGKVSVVANIDETSVQTKQLNDTAYTAGADNFFEGTATFGAGSLTLNNLVPGDAIKFDIVVKNESTVAIQYRTLITCDNDTGLFAGLNVAIGAQEYNGASNVTNWATLAPGSAEMRIPVVVELPESAGNDYQGKTCSILYKVEAVQGNAEMENPDPNTYYLYTSHDLMALSGKYLVANNGVAQTANVQLMNNINANGATFKEIGVAYGDTLNFYGNGYTISNIKLDTGKHNGLTNVGMFYVDTGATLNVENLKLVNPVVADGIDEYTTGAAAVVGYANGAVNLNNVDVDGANVNNTYGNAAIYVGYMVNEITMTNCDVINSVASGEIENGAVRLDKTGAFAATVNTAGGLLTLTNCTNTTALPLAGRVINDASMIVDGAYYVTTASGFKAALKSSASDVSIILADGEYDNVLTASNKNISVKGGKGASINLTKSVSTAHDHLGLGGCNVTLEGVTVTFEDGGYYPAYINANSIKYVDCAISGQFYIYGDTSFIGCTFNNAEEAAKTGFRYVYVYAGDVVVDDCDFNTQGHSLIMYSDNGGGGDCSMTVKNSRFHGGVGRTAGAVKNQNTAAIEIDGSCGADYTLTLEGTNTVDGGFSGLWRIKAMKDGVTTTVNGTAYTGTTSTVYLDGEKYFKDSKKNVYAYDGEFIVVNTAAEIESFYNAGFTKIKLANDVVGDITIKQKEGVTGVVIDGAQHTFTGILTVMGNKHYKSGGDETLTIQNINFIAKAGADACILSPDRTDTGVYSYSHYVTVSNCTFTDRDGVVDCAAIRHGDGGDAYWTVENCVVDNKMHSLLQVNNVEGKLTIDGCTVNSKNGVNLNSTTNLEMTNCTFNTVGYCVRIGVSSGGEPNAVKTLVFTKNSLTSQNDDNDAVIIFRGSAANANTTVTMTQTTLTGANGIQYTGDANVNINNA